MRLYIVPNINKDTTNEALDFVQTYMTNHGHTFVLDESEGTILPNDDQYDAVLALGGDGTFLRGARIAYHFNKPIMGINTGTEGRLMEIDLENYQDLFPKWIESDLAIRTLECPLIQYVLPNSQEGVAINEVACTILTSVTHFDLINAKNRVVYATRASGILLCSPIGSTGYNLSAGGAVLSHTLDAFEVTPICSFSGDKYSKIIRTDSTYTLTSDKAVYVSVDGEDAITINENEKIMFDKAERPLLLQKIA